MNGGDEYAKGPGRKDGKLMVNLATIRERIDVIQKRLKELGVFLNPVIRPEVQCETQVSKTSTADRQEPNSPVMEQVHSIQRGLAETEYLITSLTRVLDV